MIDMTPLTDRQKIEFAVEELERICIGAGDYNYPDDERYLVPSAEVSQVLRVLKGWDIPQKEKKTT